MKHKQTHSIPKKEDWNKGQPFTENTDMATSCAVGLSSLYLETLGAALHAHGKLLELYDVRVEQHITNRRIKNCARELGAIINILKQYP